MRPRIAVILGPEGAVASRVIDAYINKHRLDWQQFVFDSVSWVREECVLPNAYDGIIGWNLTKVPEWWTERPVPTVVASSYPLRHNVELDDYAVGQLAARHFHDQGYRQVATVSKWNIQVRKARFTAFTNEANKLGLKVLRFDPMAKQPVREDHLFDWLRQAPHPLGVFLHQDRDAKYLLLKCQQYGIQVPNQIGILGVDNSVNCTSLKPQLSSINANIAATAGLMVLQLHRLLNGAADEPSHLRVPPLQVIERESTTLKQSGDNVVDKVLHYIRRHPGEKNRIDDLAARHHLSASQLHRRFKTAGLLPPAHYVRHHRLCYAKQLLSDTNRSITDIAVQCGSGNAACLWRLFQDADLPSPKIWRRWMQGDVRSDDLGQLTEKPTP